jgi:glycosyltransferase involved in cell wall biosynthesis
MRPRRAEPPLLLVHDESPGLGGSVTSLGALVPFLVRSGWRVEVAALQPEGWEGQGIDPHLLRRRGERIEGAGYFAREAVRALDLRALCRRLKPDLLLANNGPTANLATHLAGRSLGLPVAQYVRGPFPMSGLSGKILRSAAAVFTVGEECTRLAELVGQVAPTQVEEGLDPARWPTTRSAAAQAWVWSSALVGWKGLPLLFEAYRALGAEPPPLHVCYTTLLAGHPDAVSPPADAPSGVTLHRAPANLDAIRACASVYVHTALRPEPFGRAVLEAMAAGLCPVVPDAGTPGRLVRHGVSGLVYAAGSPSGLTEALRRAAADPEGCARLGRRAAVEARAYRSDRVFSPVLTGLERIRTEQHPGAVPVRHETTHPGRDPAWRGS